MRRARREERRAGARCRVTDNEFDKLKPGDVIRLTSWAKPKFGNVPVPGDFIFVIEERKQRRLAHRPVVEDDEPFPVSYQTICVFTADENIAQVGDKVIAGVPNRWELVQSIDEALAEPAKDTP